MKRQLLLFILVYLSLIGVFSFFIFSGQLTLINPQGTVAIHEANLIKLLVVIMLACAVPVFLFAAFVAIRYRAGRKNAKYEPEWKLSGIGTFLKWALPITIVFTFAVINWNASHKLDPYKPIGPKQDTLIIQVISLRWKWLFIYPKEKIATVNDLVIPTKTPIEFQLTSDGPMNSFWIPALSGQIYSMSGMGTHIHLMANLPGVFQGSAAEINGRGFSGMKFTTHALSSQDFDTWVNFAEKSSRTLTLEEYESLAKPSEDHPVTLYSHVDEDLYNKIMMKYMDTGHTETEE